MVIAHIVHTNFIPWQLFRILNLICAFAIQNLSKKTASNEGYIERCPRKLAECVYSGGS